MHHPSCNNQLMKKRKISQRKFSHIKKAERLEIAVLLKKKYSHRAIANALGRDHTTVDREIRNNRVKGKYQPHKAQHKSYVKRKYSKYQGMRIRDNPGLERYIKKKLRAHWSPEEISGRLKNHDTYLPYVSSRGIYKWCYSVYGQRYCRYLPKRRYRRKKRDPKKTQKTLIPHRQGLESRPQTANDRSEFGHFESDTFVSGKKHKVKTSVSVLLERKARYVTLKKIPSLKPTINNRAIMTMSQKFTALATITFDNGIENMYHEQLQKDLQIATYFCDPYSSWQKGSVENVISLVRRFIPKGANLNDYSAKEITRIENILNSIPKKCLCYKTPTEVMLENNLLIIKQKTAPGGAVEG